MKTLGTIQTLAKIGRVFSKIVFIFSIVGFCLGIAGIISLAAGAETVKLGGVTFESFIQDKADISLGTIYASITVGTIMCIGEAVLSKFSEHYFKREIADGTPFNADGAKELKRLGILVICIPVGTEIVCQIVYEIFANVLKNVSEYSFEHNGSIMLGVMFIIMSLICKYGAERFEAEKSNIIMQ